MEKGLKGKKVVICSSRKLEEISALIEKQGGVPLVRSLQGTVFLAEKEVEPDLKHFVQEGADWVVFTTGIGIETLASIAAKLGLEEPIFKRIREAKVASRGYKTLAVLKKLDINPVAVDEDGTTKGLTQALEGFDFFGKRIMIQLHGEQAPALASFFEERGATVQKILPYQHITPDEKTIAALCTDLLECKCDAVCFTTATQVRVLFDYAREHGFHRDIVWSFTHHIAAAAIGKVTAEALKEEGIERLIVPELERMGAMIVALANYFKGK